MKKIPTLFLRTEDRRSITREYNPDCLWVAAGEGIATRKYDGTACLWKDGKLWKRYDVKKGRNVPEGFMPCQEPDPVTGHLPGWVPVGDGPEDRWHREAVDSYTIALVEGKTYELVGPKIHGNPEGIDTHMLLLHGGMEYDGAPVDYDGLKAYFETYVLEGIVWHHPDGRMAKIKARDFGVKWPRK